MKIGNKILDCLPETELELVSSRLHKTTLDKDLVLNGPGTDSDLLYFPAAGLVSCMASTSLGEQLEIYAAGAQDVIGVVCNRDQSWRAKIQIPGNAAAMKRTDFLQLMSTMERFREVLCQYVAFLMARISRRVGCIRFHSISGRLCSWLAIAMDIAQSADLECTQQSIAEALGARRATVTVELGTLQRRNIVECERGQVHILDRTALNALACECFGNCAATPWQCGITD